MSGDCSDKELLTASDDASSFRILYERYWEILYRKAVSRLGNDADALIARHSITQPHLNVCQELILAHPPIGMRDRDITSGCRHHSSGSGGCHPEVGCILAGDHIQMRRKVDGATQAIIMRAARRAPESIVNAIDRVPGDPQIPG